MVSALCLMLSACGGGGSGSSGSSSNENGSGTSATQTPASGTTATSITTTPVTQVSSKDVSGTASQGASLTGKAYLKDAKGVEVSTDIGVNGTFKFAVDSLTAPYMLKAGNLYSFAPASGIANINPFTDLAAKIASNVTDLSTVYSNSAGTLATQLQTLQSKIQATVDDLNSKISQVYQKYGLTTTDQKNFMTGTITIGQGLDALFDTFKVTVASDGGISMKTISSGVTIFTAKNSGNGTMTIISESFSSNLPGTLAGSTASGSGSTPSSTSGSGSGSSSGGTSGSGSGSSSGGTSASGSGSSGSGTPTTTSGSITIVW